MVLEEDSLMDLLVEQAAKDRQEYVEERSKDIEDLEDGIAHRSLKVTRELPTKDSYFTIPSSSQKVLVLSLGTLGASSRS